MSNEAPQRDNDRASETDDSLKQQKERMEGEGQASAPGQKPQPETASTSADDLNTGKNVWGPDTTSGD